MASTVSEVQICNRGIIKAHGDLITSLSDTSEEGVLCNALYAPLRDEVLRAHFWNFAIKQRVLNRDSDTPAFEFAYQYTLPADYIRIYRLENDRYRYKIKGGKLHTDAATVKIEYVSRETDTTLFDALFTSCLATRIGAELAYTISGSETRAGTLMEEYMELLKEAKRRDGQEGSTDDLRADTFIDSRFYDSGSYIDWTRY